MSRLFTQNIGSYTDAQGNWWSQSSTINTTGNVKDHMPSQVPPKVTKKKRTKKSRGNRKLQRYRAKLIKQGHSRETITKLLDHQMDIPFEKRGSIANEHRQKSSMQSNDAVRCSYSL